MASVVYVASLLILPGHCLSLPHVPMSWHLLGAAFPTLPSLSGPVEELFEKKVETEEERGGREKKKEERENSRGKNENFKRNGWANFPKLLMHTLEHVYNLVNCLTKTIRQVECDLMRPLTPHPSTGSCKHIHCPTSKAHVGDHCIIHLRFYKNKQNANYIDTTLVFQSSWSKINIIVSLLARTSYTPPLGDPSLPSSLPSNLCRTLLSEQSLCKCKPNHVIPGEETLQWFPITTR